MKKGEKDVVSLPFLFFFQSLSARQGKALTQLSFVMIMVVHGVIRGMREKNREKEGGKEGK